MSFIHARVQHGKGWQDRQLAELVGLTQSPSAEAELAYRLLRGIESGATTVPYETSPAGARLNTLRSGPRFSFLVPDQAGTSRRILDTQPAQHPLA